MSKSNRMPEEFVEAMAQLIVSYLSAPTTKRVTSLTQPKKIIAKRSKQTPRRRMKARVRQIV
ncbi:hypothetical protein ANRL3_01872 [Anaerolineae bacterium]|nr:hypothetical protein ANRL3_01872 [Anaerolineae bacterium]